MTLLKPTCAPPPAPASASIDRDKLQALQASMGASFPELTTFFCEDLLDFRDQIRKAHQAGCYSELRRISHTLKSSSLLFGCHVLAAIAKEVEAASERHDVSPAAIEHFADSMTKHAQELKLLQASLL